MRVVFLCALQEPDLAIPVLPYLTKEEVSGQEREREREEDERSVCEMGREETSVCACEGEREREMVAWLAPPYLLRVHSLVPSF